MRPRHRRRSGQRLVSCFDALAWERVSGAGGSLYGECRVRRGTAVQPAAQWHAGWGRRRGASVGNGT